MPLLIVAAIGLFYLMPQMPHEVEIDYEFERYSPQLNGLEIEIHELSGASVRRTELHFAESVTHYRQKLKLARGTYLVKLTFDYPGRTEQAERRFDVTDAEQLELRF